MIYVEVSRNSGVVQFYLLPVIHFGDDNVSGHSLISTGLTD